MTNIGAPYISTRFTVRPGHEEEFVAAWQALTGWAMGEGIVTGATLLQSEAEPHIFRGMSYWIDEAARAHAFNDPAALEMLSGLGSHCSDVESAPYRLRATAIGTFY